MTDFHKRLYWKLTSAGHGPSFLVGPRNVKKCCRGSVAIVDDR